MATVNQMIKYAYSLVGQPYLWGGNGETIEDVIRKYADAKGQSKSNTDEMLRFIKGIVPYDLSKVHLQDCSGLMVEILRKIGAVPKDFDATAQGLFEKCEKIKKPVEGALAFYYDGKKHNHVGLCSNSGTVIHCLSVKTGVIVEPISKRADKWVDFGLPKWCIDFSYDTVTTKEDVWVYNSADEAREKPEGCRKWLYKAGEYFIYKTAKDCTNISKDKGSAGGWITNHDLNCAVLW